MIRTTGLCLLLAGPAAALELSLPGDATLTAEVTETLGSYAVPVAPWAAGALPAEQREGQIIRQSWRLPTPALTTLELLRPLRAQLTQAGLQIVFECDTAACGGFDFRFATPVLLPPEMQVNLGDFRFLSALGPDSAVTLLASRTRDAGFVQVIRVGDDLAASLSVAPTAPRATALTPQSMALADSLDQIGRVVLEGLSFESGSAQLVSGDVASLAALADYLADHPDVTIALVGHTDSAGALDGNIALSRQRAASVLERLARDYAVPRRQMEAQGMGYLSPLADNRTAAGRDRNRRVEAIITSTQ